MRKEPWESTEPINFDEEMMAKVIKDIGTSAIKINETLLKKVRGKLPEKGYLDTMLYFAQNSASIERDELHRVLTICAYHKLPPVLMPDIIENLNNIDYKISSKSIRIESTLHESHCP